MALTAVFMRPLFTEVSNLAPLWRVMTFGAIFQLQLVSFVREGHTVLCCGQFHDISRNGNSAKSNNGKNCE